MSHVSCRPGPWSVLRRWRVPLALAAILVLLQMSGWRDTLEYRRTEVLRGQVWRLLSGNLVHLGWVHLARDVTGLFLIWALLARALDEGSWLWVLLTSSLAVGLGLLAFSAGISWYVGISGTLFGLFCAGALAEFPNHRLYAGALLLGMAVVIGWTLHAGALPGETAGLGGKVVPQAHLYGALGGAMFIVTRRALRQLRRHPA
jgi:rhomboid family GlyGly-CTERM serine protease